jgi:hypothetical protein
MNASASSSSQWRTPTDDSSRGGPQSGAKRLEGGHTLNLQDQVQDFPVSTWPTPTTRDWKDTGNMENVPENFLLGRVAANWSTPRATDGEKGGPNQAFGAGGIPLPAQAQQWATPSMADTTGGRMSRSGDRSNEPLLKGQANTLVSSLPDPVIYAVGGIPSKERRSLNPLFVEWLMGWPPGWTLLAWTDFACSETALSVWKQRMRFALLQLGLPPAAPLVQHDLFAEWS